MLAYEVLLARLDSSIKSIVDELRSSKSLPSEYLEQAEGMIASELRNEVERFLASKSGFSVSIAGDFQYPQGLRDAPVELFYYPNEEHAPDHPQARLATLQRNIDWYRFWLQGYERPTPEDKTQYARWWKLRDKQVDGN